MEPQRTVSMAGGETRSMAPDKEKPAHSGKSDGMQEKSRSRGSTKEQDGATKRGSALFDVVISNMTCHQLRAADSRRYLIVGHRNTNRRDAACDFACPFRCCPLASGTLL